MTGGECLIHIKRGCDAVGGGYEGLSQVYEESFWH